MENAENAKIKNFKCDIFGDFQTLVFENHSKSRIQHSERRVKITKNVHFGEFLYSKACDRTVLPDRTILIGQKLVENATF